ncbi:S-adenosylmethionine decarboxylase [Fomitopsis serialis]|uniref:S-adenosylmethionine decarboxylase n=1 Tax=Fomitopsis serialis TaxID=139415 RepID=UPI002008BF41|nr:S-adenosylmethionine decarboxylase [Neoantrodia serialis]KAH9935393.1 S-adenosylmethionine decarboxylase [Neoantrodia serialis]
MAACPEVAPTGPFEGPEKLLEIWFKPTPADVPDAASPVDGKFGLRRVPRQVWADMLDIVQCKILSVVEGMEMDAYLLSESSFFVSPHRLILKTCGTTLNLLGVPRILEIARDHASLPSVYRLFYSRKAFMFPERQMGPHRDWRAEIDYLDNIFPNGAAYTIGKVNGDHWLLYMTTPGDDSVNGSTRPNTPLQHPLNGDASEEQANGVDADGPTPEQTPADDDDEISQDYTIEILMTHLSPTACAPFMTSTPASSELDASPSAQAMSLSSSLGISQLFPPHVTTLDAYSFTPCGYSCNALLKWCEDAGTDPAKSGEGYYTIHVTPESGWSYASFECNVPLPSAPLALSTGADGEAAAQEGKKRIPDLRTLIRRVVSIFQPGRLTLTLFVSSEDNNNAEEEDGESAVEAAQRAFKAALTQPCARGAKGTTTTLDPASPEGSAPFSGLYKRTDKINYEFGGYDLAFATFELRQ